MQAFSSCSSSWVSSPCTTAPCSTLSYWAAEHPTHTYGLAGTYTVILTATNTMTSTSISHDVVIGAAPTAGFTFAVAGYDVTFTNSSTGATSYLWTFGDTGTSTETNPLHTYAANGVYTVTLTVYNDCGQDVYSTQVTIDVGPTQYYIYLPLVIKNQ